MLMTRALALASVCVICTVLSVASAIASECQQESSFGNWLQHFKQEATGLSISQPTIASALNGITLRSSDYRARPFAKRFPAEL
jgi:membrane-bound lytic murein transglycosylase B